MTNTERKQKLVQTGMAVGLTCLAFVGTMIVRIPIPLTSGYFNIGDAFVIFSGLLLGPRVGLIVGFFGPAIADAIGYPQYIVATAIIKGCEGFAVGALAGGSSGSGKRKLFAAIVGAAIMVGGYFVFEAFIYPAWAKVIPFFGVTTPAAAVSEIGANTVQGVFGALAAVGAWSQIRSRQKAGPNTIDVGL